MSLKFTFGGASPEPHDHSDRGADGAPSGIPLPFVGASGGPPVSTSSTLELRVTREGGELVCVALSGDGVDYARASKRLRVPGPSGLAAAARSVIARAGAELPEPLLGAVTAIVLSLDGAESAVLAELNLSIDRAGSPPATVDHALQSRTGIAAGTPIRFD
ncbi:hypothetical protein J4H92_02810 [Leucobacter weissii]|uniref:Uncharacterized protein n=1 Tax=Leucobacter weissii TaxID=1983706 RepID=A0A939MHL0_9MICO|nr:hypothetical protein [Leucobacter weissii]MBO1900878.1 hypothetical protein [Leucobacter weissii]